MTYLKRFFCVFTGIFLLASANTAWLSAQAVLGEETDNQQFPVEFELDEVVVSASAPFFSRKGNRLIANVSASRLSSVGTALDVAGYIPGITIKDRAITVFGKGSPIIYINNRKLYDETELQRLQSSDIATIELITNPDARYDAEGRAVLIIKTKQYEENGWAMQVNELFKQGRYPGDREDISLSYTHDNLSLFASYNHSANKDFQQPEIIYTNHRDTLWQQFITSSQFHKSLEHLLSAGIDWTITKKQSIGGQYQGSLDDYRMKTNNSEEIWADGNLYDKIKSHDKPRNESYQHLVNAFYQGDYNDSFGLRFDMDYIRKHSQSNQKISESSPLENREVNMTSQSDFKLYAGKLTSVYRLGENSRWESGVECGLIEGSGFTRNPEQYIPNTIYTNREEKMAGFTGYSRRFGQLDFQLGVRYEWVHSKSIDDSTRHVGSDRISRGLYPALSLSQKVGETQMGLELSRKTKRPDFSELNDNYYINRFLVEKGNPYLLNKDFYLIDYYLKYKFLDFQLGYVYIKNPISFGLESEENNSSQIIMKYINYPQYQEINALLTTEFEYKRWKSRVSGGMNQPFFSVVYLGEKLKRNRPAFSVQFFNDLVFLKDYIFSVHFIYEGKNYREMVEQGGYETLELGLRKSFFDKKLSLNLQAYDVFNWVREKITLETNNISYIKKTDILESRYITLTINYRFHNYKKKYRGGDAAGDDKQRL